MSEFVAGLDVGMDGATIALVERIIKRTIYGDRVKRELIYRLRHLERYREMSYPQIVEKVTTLLRKPEFGEKFTLVVDVTGLGKVMGDTFSGELKWDGLRRFEVVSVKIINGTGKQRRNNGSYTISKDVLLKPLISDFGSERFLISNNLSDKDEFLKQMSYTKTDSNHTNYTNGGDNDYVLATALAVWKATR